MATYGGELHRYSAARRRLQWWRIGFIWISISLQGICLQNAHPIVRNTRLIINRLCTVDHFILLSITSAQWEFIMCSNYIAPSPDFYSSQEYQQLITQRRSFLCCGDFNENFPLWKRFNGERVSKTFSSPLASNFFYTDNRKHTSTKRNRSGTIVSKFSQITLSLIRPEILLFVTDILLK